MAVRPISLELCYCEQRLSRKVLTFDLLFSFKIGEYFEKLASLSSPRFRFSACCSEKKKSVSREAELYLFVFFKYTLLANSTFSRLTMSIAAMFLLPT